MALPPLITTGELEVWLGSPLSNHERAAAIVDAASTLVRRRSGRMWVDADGEPEDDISETQLASARSVVTTVSARVWSNPHGETQEAIVGYSRSLAEWSTLGLALTDEELAQLGPTSGASGLGVVRTTRGTVESPYGLDPSDATCP